MLARRMGDGIDKVGASVPVTMVTRAELDAASLAFGETETDFGAARSALHGAYRVFTPAEGALHRWLNAARPVFVSSFGYRWSGFWAPLGFFTPSTAIPKTIPDRFGVANSMLKFLKDNPSYEVEKCGVTYVNGSAIYDAASLAEEGVTAAKVALETAKQARAAAKATLLRTMRTLVKNLEGKLARDDTRWLSFGLNIPAAPTTAAKPTGLRAQFDKASGGALLFCDPEAFARRWRFRGRLAGSGGPFQLMASSTEPLGRTRWLKPGTTMEFIVQAANGNTQSVPSDPILFTVPGPAGEEIAPPASAAPPMHSARKRRAKMQQTFSRRAQPG